MILRVQISFGSVASPVDARSLGLAQSRLHLQGDRTLRELQLKALMQETRVVSYLSLAVSL